MERYIKSKKGYTLIETMVGMSIFTIVMAMVIGFFIALYRLQTVYRLTANQQQEGRIISEFFTRNAREATAIDIVENDGDGDICSDADMPSIGPSDDSVKLSISEGDGSEKHIRLLCTRYWEGGPNYLAAKVWRGNEEPENPYSLTSGNVSISSFIVSRPKLYGVDVVTYPKVLKYQINIKKSNLSNYKWHPDDEIPLEGEKIRFQGYINMRNEL